ncbi:E3 ubiquitin-protein ligase ATL9-like [Amaranthus tricolor]|uniref:E3 ubiquitin-protein ligase ATL9-like n=1 Tax=Amaranthus tricolor TaxID=29722 RepID=UPI002588FEED|nr:E3 ubiquitin-protein ligase ATL9-like [Amaranthus tricolor]
MATSITIFLVFLLLTKCCCKRRVDPNPNIEDPFSGGPRGVDQTVIDSLMTFTYTLAQGKKLCRGMNVCVICLAVFREHETLRSMPRCGHVFHSGCDQIIRYERMAEDALPVNNDYDTKDAPPMDARTTTISVGYKKGKGREWMDAGLYPNQSPTMTSSTFTSASVNTPAGDRVRDWYCRLHF